MRGMTEGKVKERDTESSTRSVAGSKSLGRQQLTALFLQMAQPSMSSIGWSGAAWKGEGLGGFPY